VLSEVAPQHDWVELYNPTTITQTVSAWQLDDGFALTAPFTLTDVVIAPHGFAVIEGEQLRQFEPGTLQLSRPDRRVADVTTYTTINPGTTWSRYPVHGGGWQANTPPTPGRLNLPAPATPTLVIMDTPEALAMELAAPEANTPLPTEQPTDAEPRMPVPWPLLLLLPTGGVIMVLWAGRRKATPLE
jgi:hypothetical protein